MKQLFIFIFLMWGIVYSARAMDADVQIKVFNDKSVSYIELHVYILGEKVHFLPLDVDSLTWQANVGILMLVKDGETVVNYEKYDLKSPVFDRWAGNFRDVRRLSVEEGTYDVEVSIVDLNDANNKFNWTGAVLVDKDAFQSDVLLLASAKSATSQDALVRNGFRLEPLPFSFYTKNYRYLTFYNELYHISKATNDDYIKLIYTLYKAKNGNKPERLYKREIKKRRANVFVPLLYKMDIGEAPSGNYVLELEVVDLKNRPISIRRVEFQRSNPYLEIKEKEVSIEELTEEFVHNMSEKELAFALRAVAVIITDDRAELIRSIIREKNYEAQKIFLFTHFATINPITPYRAYLDYMKLAQAVDAKFYSGYGYGFETDRGTIFLKYGTPSEVISEINDPSAPPYEIWTYNDFPVTNQGEVKFVFYNPSLAPEDYILLHSTARGEISNRNWQQMLYNSVPGTQGGSTIDQNSIQGIGSGRNAGRNFSDF